MKSAATPFSDLATPPSVEVSDEEMVERYLQSRNPADFEILVRRYERELYAFLRRFVGDNQMAEDVFQATFLSVHLRIHQFEKGRRFRPWLYAIASNKSIDFMRRNKRHNAVSLNASLSRIDSDEPTMLNQLEGDETQPVENVIENERRDQVRAAVRELSEPTQQLIQLAFYQQLKYSDISEILQIPIGTVKSRVFTAMRKLNQIWMRMNPNDASVDP